MISVSAFIFNFFAAVVVIFQLLLALGQPWGSLAMGGKYPGKFPPLIRFLAVIQGALMAFMGVIVSIRAGLIFPEWFDISKKIIWVVVAFNVLSVIGNLATSSKWERIIGAPVSIILLGCSIFLAAG
ncbi:MAG: hypothetical protein COB67_08135 [SAR324 cluster bacterium]|uniref:Uncharacterized protein n=1 Tax=SAR324 cluster bacterium TaxID=2024889 RepID=A0A2A4T2P7_9DELT|nr:MAG: hypothetical protein COB67_08135 [SAR324 cluster bacterium]